MKGFQSAGTVVPNTKEKWKLDKPSDKEKENELSIKKEKPRNNPRAPPTSARNDGKAYLSKSSLIVIFVVENLNFKKIAGFVELN